MPLLLSRRALLPPFASGVLLRAFFADFSSWPSSSEVSGVSDSLPSSSLSESSDFSLSTSLSSLSAGFSSPSLFDSVFSPPSAVSESSPSSLDSSSGSSSCFLLCASPWPPWWASSPDGQRYQTDGTVTAIAPAALDDVH